MLKAELKVIGGTHAGELIPLAKQRFLIGRGDDCQLRPASEQVSRNHCAFSIDDYTVRLRDLGSTNGTYVNDERLHGEVILKQGDRVRVGSLHFEMQISQEQVEHDQAATTDAEAGVSASPLAPDTTELSATETALAVPSPAETSPEQPVPAAETTAAAPTQQPSPEWQGHPGQPPSYGHPGVPPGQPYPPSGQPYGPAGPYPPGQYAPGQYPPQPPGGAGPYPPPGQPYPPPPGGPYPQQYYGYPGQAPMPGSYPPQQGYAPAPPDSGSVPELPVQLPTPENTGAAASGAETIPAGETTGQSASSDAEQDEKDSASLAADIIKNMRTRRPE